MLRSLLAMLLVLAIPGCSLFYTTAGAPSAEPLTAGGLELRAEGSRFARTAPIPLTLTNTSAVSYEGGVVTCATTEEWTGNRWFRIDDRRACIAMAVRLSPGSMLDGAVELDVPPGTYRLVHTMTDMGTGIPVRVATAPFQITG